MNLKTKGDFSAGGTLSSGLYSKGIEVSTPQMLDLAGTTDV